MALFQNSDIFDTGSDGSDNETAPPKSTTARLEPQEEVLAQEHTDVSASASRKKGDGRTQRKSQKLKKSEMFEVHSESQRMIRESKLSLPKHQPRMRTIDSFLKKVNNTLKLQPCTQNIVKTIKSTHFAQRGEDPVSEPGETAALCASQDGDRTVTSPDKENIVKPLIGESQSTAQPNDSSLPEPKLSSFAIADFSTSITMETKEPTELEQLKVRFAAQLQKTKKAPHMSTVVTPLATETPSLIPPELVVQLKDKPGAIRQHLSATLKRQLSQKRAEERKMAEEERRLYGEEGPGDVEGEDEAELTDQDTTDAECSEGEGHGGPNARVKAVEPSEKMDGRSSDSGDGPNEGPNEGPSDGKVDPSDGEGDPSDGEGGPSDREGGPSDGEGDPSDGDGDASDGEGDPSDGEGDASDGSDVPSDDDVALTAKRTSTVKRQRIDSDEEVEVPQLPTLTQSVSFGSFNSESVLTAGSSTNTHQHIVQAVTSEHTSAVEGCMQKITSGGARGTQLTSERPFASLTAQEAKCETVEVCRVRTEEGLPMDSGLGLSSQENSSSQLVIDSSSQEGACPQVGSEQGVCPQVGSEEGACPQVAADGGLSAADSNFSSLPPAQQAHTQMFKVSMTCRKNSTVSNQSDQKLFETQTPDSSQDPFDCTESSSARAWPKGKDVQPNVSCIEDSQTQFLDAQGYLCVDKRSSVLKTVASHTLDEPSDELLGLCSGSFGTQEASKEGVGLPLPHKTPLSGLLSSIIKTTLEGSQAALEGTQGTDVLAFCSGVFPSSPPAGKTVTKGDTGGDIGDSGTGSVLERWALRHSQLPEKGEDGEESDDEDMPILLRRRISHPKPKPTASERLQEFVESEAELSGEDVGPDEDREPEGPDEYEEEEGAELESVLSETELRNQVTRVHTKHTLADDKAELLELQERFLKEGDLYEDGLALRNGFFRTRHFGPTGSEGSMDLFAEDRTLETELDMEEDNSQAEVMRRKDRLEREEFMRKCREREGSLLEIDEDSQSILNIIRDTSSHSLLNTPSSSRLQDDSPTPSSTSAKRSRGSFLKHDSATLRRLSSITAVTPSVSNKAFVFHKSTPGQSDTPTSSSKTKSGNSGLKNRQVEGKDPKRPKLDDSISLSISESSVFSLLK